MKLPDYNFLASSIKDGKCVLLLGPELAVDNKGVTFSEDMKSFLEERANITLEYDMDNFPVMADNYYTKYQLIKNFEEYISERPQLAYFYNLLAQIPFHLILTLSPDKLLKSAFLDYEHEEVIHSYYDFNTNLQKIDEPTSTKPLIYSMLGSIDNSDSLVLTSQDMIKYIGKILGPHKFPDILMNKITEVKVYIFLGFNYTSWYLKLILSLLLKSNNSDTSDSNRYAINIHTLDNKVSNFYLLNFKLNFISGSVTEIVENIYQASKNKGMLKMKKVVPIQPLKPKSNQFVSEARSLIKKNNLEEALEIIGNYESLMEKYNSDLLKEYYLVSRIYYENKQNYSKGTIYYENYHTETNKATNSLLSIIKSLAELIEKYSNN